MTSPTDAEVFAYMPTWVINHSSDDAYLAGYRAAEAANAWREIDPSALPECPCLVADSRGVHTATAIWMDHGQVNSWVLANKGEWPSACLPIAWRPLPEGPK